MAEESGEALSERELEILRLVATGVTNREIAARLVISPNTVKVHLRNIFAKLGVESRTEASLVAIQNGWIEVPGALAAQVPAAVARPSLSWGRRTFLVAALAGSLLLALLPRTAGQAPEPASALSDRGPSSVAPASPDSAPRWTPRAALPAPRERFAVASLGGLIYVIGGDTAKGVVGSVEIYDPGDDVWRVGVAKPTAASNVAAAQLGDEIYVPGGYDDAEKRVLSVVEVYKPATDSWRTADALPAPRCAYAIASTGGRIYLFGGWDGSRYVGDVLIYDPQGGRWSYGTPMAQGRGFAAAVAVEGRIYLLGGYDGVNELTDCEVYDPSLEGSGRSPWKALSPMSQARGGLGAAAVGNRLYAIGGGWNGGLTCSESYDIARDQWQRFATPILGQWRALGVAAAQSPLGTTLFAMGGWTGDWSAVNQAYRASLNLYLPGLR